MVFNWILGRFSADLAIDLGTATVLVYETTKGVVIYEPSVVAMREETRKGKQILAVGKNAKGMIGRTHPGITAVRPIRSGVIADFEVTEVLLRHFILQAHERSRLVRPRIIVCVPHGATDVERRAVRESAFAAGAREVYLIAEPLAAAIGAGLPISEPTGNMVLDIGGGTTEASVISLSGIVYTHCIQVAGDTLNETILNYVKRKYDLLIGETRAEEIKIELAAAGQNQESRTMEIKGRDLRAGLPRRIQLQTEEISEAIKEPIDQIVDAVKITLERTPPELSVDIMERGLTLTGGGALLRGLQDLLQTETNLPVRIAHNPVACVVLGSGMALKDPELLGQVALEG